PLGRWRPFGVSVPEETALPPEPLSRLVREKGLLFVLAIAFGVLTLVLQRREGTAASLALLPIGSRLANASSGYLWYVGKTLLPTDLGLFYFLRLDRLPPLRELVVAVVMLLGVTVALARRFRRAP